MKKNYVLFLIKLILIICGCDGNAESKILYTYKWKPVNLICLDSNSDLTISNFMEKSIEDVILSLRVEPDSKSVFRDMVTSARNKFTINRSKDANLDRLYIGSDGQGDFSEFFIDRKSMVLRVKYSYEMAPEHKGVYYLHFTGSYWIQSEKQLPKKILESLLKKNMTAGYWSGVQS
jgi:hypothetical protein